MLHLPLKKSNQNPFPQFYLSQQLTNYYSNQVSHQDSNEHPFSCPDHVSIDPPFDTPITRADS
jgi:hypothetical protein